MSETWIKDNWDVTKGRSIAIKISDHIVSYSSKFQKIDIYDSQSFGKVLTLDDVIMVTERDEFAYHEMIAHVALNVHPNPKKVLVIGGGDGGTAREALKHDVDEVVLCEIDEEMIKVSREHLPFTAACFDDPRLTIDCKDGAKFIKERPNYYDVILVDSSDPIGPAQVLFQEKFYRDMFDALTDDGIVVTQSESMFYDQKIITDLFKFNRQIYPVVKYYYTLVPTYPSGTIGFSFCSKKYDPEKDLNFKNIDGLRYYTNDLHLASFKLPNFMLKQLK